MYNLEEKLKSTNVAFSGSEFLSITLIVAIIAWVVLAVVPLFLPIPFPFLPGWIYGGIVFVIIFLAMIYVLPYFLMQQRVSEIEEPLPDALRQMSTALRAGVSMDEALEDVSKSNYGALSEEFERTISQVRRGRSMKGALKAMASRNDSDLLQRAFFLVVEGMERGAELADVLEAVSEDIRETHTIQRQRKSSTTQQVMFLLAASLFAAPFITGLVVALADVFATMGASGGGSGGMEMGGAILPPGTTMIISLFIIIQAAITSLAVGVIRYGEFGKGLMYIPLFAPASFGVFYGAKIALGFLL